MSDFELNAKIREDKGKGASRRLRRLAHEVPAIIYGGKKDPVMISLSHKDFAHSLSNEAFYSHIVTLNVEGKSEDVILKDVQRHPHKPFITHADFYRIDKNQKLTVKAPLHFINEDQCYGVKMEGGVITHSITELEISCLPADLPEYIAIDMTDLKMDEILHISDIKLPEGVESVALSHGDDHDLPVAAIHMPRAALEEEEPVEAEDDAADTEAEDKAEGDTEGEDED